MNEILATMIEKINKLTDQDLQKKKSEYGRVIKINNCKNKKYV